MSLFLIIKPLFCLHIVTIQFKPDTHQTFASVFNVLVITECVIKVLFTQIKESKGLGPIFSAISLGKS